MDFGIYCNEVCKDLKTADLEKNMIYDRSYRSATVCTAVTGSMTMALKAQKALSKATIRANTVKVNRSERGCVYGVEFDCALLGNVKALLNGAGIEVKEFLR